MDFLANGIDFKVTDESPNFGRSRKFVIDGGDSLFYLYYNHDSELWHLDDCGGGTLEVVGQHEFSLESQAIQWACTLISNGDL